MELNPCPVCNYIKEYTSGEEKRGVAVLEKKRGAWKCIKMETVLGVKHAVQIRLLSHKDKNWESAEKHGRRKKKKWWEGRRKKGKIKNRAAV